MQPDKAGIPRIAKSMGHEIIGRKQSSEEFHRSPPAIDSSYERKGGASGPKRPQYIVDVQLPLEQRTPVQGWRVLVSSVINTPTLAICPVQYAAIRYTKCKCNNYVHLEFVLVRYATLQFAAN